MTALATLHDRMVASFAAAAFAVVPEFGDAALHLRTDLNQKVVLAPGDESRSLGKLGAAQGPGGEPKRRIASLDELFRIYVSAYDRGSPDDPKRQYVATRELFDSTYATLFGAYRAFVPVSCKWVVGSVVAPFGMALMLVGSVRDAIFDWSEGEALLVAPVKYSIAEKIKVPSGQESEE